MGVGWGGWDLLNILLMKEGTYRQWCVGVFGGGAGGRPIDTAASICRE